MKLLSRLAAVLLSLAAESPDAAQLAANCAENAFYVIEGEQCLQTPGRGVRMRKGETLAIPAGVPMRVMATGSEVRRALAVIVHDADQPPTMRMSEQNSPKLAACE